MKLSPDLVGTILKSHQTQINWRQTTNYAAAVQDNNPVYYDDRSENNLLSHPLFPVSVTWPVLSRLDTFIESNVFPKAVLLTQVHYSEHLVLHRLIRPGDVLNISGSLAAFLPHRAGTHAIIRLRATDKNQAPVFTEYIGAMLRGVDCGRGKQSGDIPDVPKNTVPGENRVWQSKIFIDPLQPYLYDGCTGIEFPIHTSPSFALAVGLPGIILQGTATLAYAVREIVNREAGMDPSRISQIACRFTGMVCPGTSIRVCCTEKNSYPDHADLFFQVKNSENQLAVRNGYVKIKRGQKDA
jgi:acyl dehydratase